MLTGTRKLGKHVQGHTVGNRQIGDLHLDSLAPEPTLLVHLFSVDSVPQGPTKGVPNSYH